MAVDRRYEPTEEERRAIGEVRACIEEAVRWHRPFVSRVERRYEAWRGMRADNAPKGWRSNVQQPLLINVIEGMLSSMEEAEPRWSVSPTVLPGLTVEEAIAVGENAEFGRYLLTQQMRDDGFDLKQGPFMLQDLIAGYTPGKVSWVQKVSSRATWEEREEMVWDDEGGALDIAVKVEEGDEDYLCFDGPSFQPRDVRDFLFPESATSLEDAPWVIDRTFVTYTTCERMERLGIFKNVRHLKETRPDKESKDERTSRTQMSTTHLGMDVAGEREHRLRGADRTRGLVELVELWLDDRVITVGNGSILLREEKRPRGYEEKPFISSCAIPGLFEVVGVSVVEGLAAMQEMVWTLQNTRLDAARMLANPVQLIRSDVEDRGAFEWAPLAQWIISHPDQVKLLEVNPVLAQITLQHEALLKGDIQNVMGGLPYTGGAESQTIDQNTATGISIITNIAQQILQRRKQQHLRAFSRIGKKFLTLDQALLREERLVWIPGAKPGTGRWLEIDWRRLKGAFDVSVTMQGDSMMRQERRAESGVLLTQSHQMQGQAAMAGVRLNLKRFWEKHLEAYDIPDKETYFLPDQPQQSLTAGAQPGLPAGGTPPQAEQLMEDMAGDLLSGGGTTNAGLAAGPSSPSNSGSMSIAAPMQRALAATGAGESA